MILNDYVMQIRKLPIKHCTMVHWVHKNGSSWIEGNFLLSIQHWQLNKKATFYLLFSFCSWIEGKFSPSVQLSQLENCIKIFLKICIIFSFQLICYQSILNKRYFIAELKFEWPHNKISPGSSSENTPNTSSQWEGRKIWFGEARPTPQMCA